MSSVRHPAAPIMMPSVRTRPRGLVWLHALMALSGCAALIYEVVWFQLLSFVIGVSAVSLGVLLATFLGGLFGGSLLLARLISPARAPLRVYALLELGVGLCGAVALYAIPVIGTFSSVSTGSGSADLTLRVRILTRRVL